MSYTEEELVARLTERFPSVTTTEQRERRIWLTSPREGFIDLLTYIHDDLGFNMLCTVSGLDAGEEFQLIYHIAHDCGIVINARVSAPADNPVFDTATNIYKGGVLYELEARNLFGLTILGIPEDIRYPLPENWPQGEYPLRKSWVLPADRVPESDEQDTPSEDTPASAEGASPPVIASEGEAEARQSTVAVASSISDTAQNPASSSPAEGSDNG
ncbi:MAG: NADH-quinone oxidoreductase subunit C [Coriobacteriia bacterium]|nr:NADH-quinone oxidoreductase subunit C [Coriobacteriia bacterium]